MEIEVKYGPGNAASCVKLSANESFTAEAGSMIAMSGDVSLQTTTHKRQGGGVFKAMKRMLAGESFFLNHYTASSQGGEVWLSTTLAGDMKVHELKGDTLIVQAGSYVGSDEGVDIDLGWTGMKALFSGESFFWLKASGSGKMVLSSFGAIYPLDVDGEVIVDSGHIVAFESGLDYKISKAGSSWINSFLGGEGFVCRFQGKGRVWCQSHNPKGFGQILGPMLRPREN